MDYYFIIYHWVCYKLARVEIIIQFIRGEQVVEVSAMAIQVLLVKDLKG